MKRGKFSSAEEPAPAMATIHAITPNETVEMAKGSPKKLAMRNPMTNMVHRSSGQETTEAGGRRKRGKGKKHEPERNRRPGQRNEKNNGDINGKVVWSLELDHNKRENFLQAWGAVCRRARLQSRLLFTAV